MARIEAVLVDSREPDWVQGLTFGGAPTSVTMLEECDIKAITSDGHTLVVERKTPDDLLNTLKEERLFPQMTRLSDERLTQQLAGYPPTSWPYLLICGQLSPGPNGKVMTERGVTGWSYGAVMGALLSIQEMGVFVVFCGDTEFEKTIISLGSRERDGVQKILPPRPAVMLGPGAAFLASLPGIGPERVIELMRWSANIPAHALAGIVDLEIEAPLPENTRKRIRAVLGLKDRQILEIWMNNRDEEVLKVLERMGSNV